MRKGVIATSLLIMAIGLCLLFPQKTEAKDSDGDIVIIVDAGHGGKDGGAYQNNLTEATINWNMALALKCELETYAGVKVYMTRGSNEWHSNTGRGQLGKALGADLIVSLHNNSGSTTASGVEVYATVNSNYSAAMQTLANRICTAVSSLGLKNGGYRTRYSSSDSTRDYYTLLDEAGRAGIPSMIIEHCYLSNSSDAAFIASVSNQYKCGVADAKAIADYYGLSKRTVTGDAITLTRTYSAYMQGEGTYATSNESVAHVRADGLITATGAGSAVVTCTLADGSTKSVTVTVPEVRMVGLAAGSATTFFSESDIRSNFTNGLMVKAIYSDGSVTQVSGYTIGTFPSSGTAYPSVSSEVGYDVPISYNGYTCALRIYGWSKADSTVYSTSLAAVAGSNSDILLLPESYTGINTGSGTAPAPTTPTEAVTEAVTETPTEEETTLEESTTEEITTEAVAEEVTTKETTTEDTTSEIVPLEIDGSDDEVIKDDATMIVGWLALIALVAVSTTATIIIRRKK